MDGYGPGGDGGLLERHAELARLDELIGRAVAGTGGAVVIEGAAGIGKTELLRAARRHAEAAGMAVLGARCGELERDMGFGVARQLLERAVVSGPDELLAGAAGLARGPLGLGGTEPAASDQFAALHGLYWLCANLSDRTPVLLAIDDAHWADVQSLRWLAYLIRRAEDHPILVVLTLRTGEPGAANDAVQSMLGERAVEPMTLRPLAPAAVRSLIQARLAGAQDAFCAACHAASGGNPLLLHELLTAVDDGGIAGHANDAERVEGLGAAGVSRHVNARLIRLGEPSAALARAAAVLGTGAEPVTGARLAGITREAAARAADELRAADILRDGSGLEFVHPLVRSAVYADIPTGARGEAHGAAARILVDADGGADRVGAHLLVTPPGAEPWVVAQLRSAAAGAIAAGAPDSAATLLERALAEPPAPEDRVAVLMECGTATSMVDPNGAAERFAEALALTDAPAPRARTVRALAKSLGYSDRCSEAVQATEAVLADAGGVDGELLRLVECERVMWGHFWSENPDRAAHAARLERLADGLPGTTVSERTALGLRAWHLVIDDVPAARSLAAARGALGPGKLFTDPEQGFDIPTLVAATHMYCDELDEAFALFDRGIEELREAGWLVHLIFTYSHRAHVRLRQGWLLEAEADAATAWELAGQLGPGFPPWWFAFGNMIQVLVARGDPGAAQALVEATGIGDLSPDAVIFPLPRVVRGQLHAALGEHQRAVDELLAAGAMLDERGFRNPSWSPWRILVAPSLAALGRRDEARATIAEAVARARRVGAPLALGAALRVAGELEAGEAGLELLAESVAVLEASPGRLEHATSLIALGAALRRAQRRADAREPLRSGIELAERCGARGLAERGREELAAAGGRMRKAPETGPAALTASELRVARRAADGLSNKEIAQDLFVTIKTVEKHLAGGYRKLDCTRAELHDALG